MPKLDNNLQFKSPVAPLIIQFIQEKRACGYRYHSAPKILMRFDRFLCDASLSEKALPEHLVLKWLEKLPEEKPSTQKGRVCLIRQFAKMMVRLGYPAYIVPDQFIAPRLYTFSPYIFTRKQVTQLIHAADQIKPTAKSPLRHLIMPEIFRLYYTCGFRINEVLHLRMKDVDFKRGVLIIRDAKFGKDRLVPPALDIINRLQIYDEQMSKHIMGKRTEEDFFFPSAQRKSWHPSSIYMLFRELLYQCGIPHPGRGKGPRVHDLRHTFAVHRLIQWYEAGADLNTKLPLLVAYLGHQDFTGTQKYLHLTAELFPELTKRMNEQFGGVIPHGR